MFGTLQSLLHTDCCDNQLYIHHMDKNDQRIFQRAATCNLVFLDNIKREKANIWVVFISRYTHQVCTMSACLYYSKQSEVLLGLCRDRMASVAISCVPSKRSFLLSTVNRAPSPTLRASNMVSYFHEEPQ